MTPILTTLAPGLLEAGSRLIDRLVPDPAEREKPSSRCCRPRDTGTAGDADQPVGDPG